METILEQQRRYHEERERLQDAMVKEMMYTKKTVCVCLHNVNSSCRHYIQKRDAGLEGFCIRICICISNIRPTSVYNLHR